MFTARKSSSPNNKEQEKYQKPEMQTKAHKTHKENPEIDKQCVEENVTDKDYSTLEGTNWLNGDVINDYLKMINDMDEKILIFSSYFHTAFREGGFKRVKSYYRKHDLLGYKHLYIPVHKDNHWFLIIYSHNVLEAYDPYNYPQASSSERLGLLEHKKKSLMKIMKVLEDKYFKPLFKLKNNL